jgi:uncharacterized protein
MTADQDRMRNIIRSSAWLMAVLRAVRQAGLADAWVGAGALRDLVWGAGRGCRSSRRPDGPAG